MQVSAWETYYPTLLHWVITGGGIIGLMLLLYRVLRVFGVKREAATGYALVLPWILGLLIWNIYPFARSLYLSFTKYNIFQPPEWVGIENYVRMFTKDRQFWPSLRFTLSYAVLNVPLGIAGALGVALLLNRDVKGIGIWRTIDGARKLVLNLVFFFILLAILAISMEETGVVLYSDTALVLQPRGMVVEQYSIDPTERAINQDPFRHRPAAPTVRRAVCIARFDASQ